MLKYKSQMAAGFFLIFNLVVKNNIGNRMNEGVFGHVCICIITYCTFFRKNNKNEKSLLHAIISINHLSAYAHIAYVLYVIHNKCANILTTGNHTKF